MAYNHGMAGHFSVPRPAHAQSDFKELYMANYDLEHIARPHLPYMYQKHPQTSMHVGHHPSQYSAMMKAPSAVSPQHFARSPSSTIFPRRKAGEDVRSNATPIHITREVLTSFFGQPLKVAAKELGICITAMKTVCRKFGIVRWPYRRLVRRHAKGADESGESEEPTKGPVQAEQSKSHSSAVQVKEEPAARPTKPLTVNVKCEVEDADKEGPLLNLDHTVESPLSDKSWIPCCSGGCSLCREDSSEEDSMDQIGQMISAPAAWEGTANSAEHQALHFI